MLLLLAFVLNTLLVSGAILIHYEVLFWLDRKLPRIAHIAPRFRVLIGVAVIFVTHVVEIWLFALGYFLSLKVEGMGTIVRLLGAAAALRASAAPAAPAAS